MVVFSLLYVVRANKRLQKLVYTVTNANVQWVAEETEAIWAPSWQTTASRKMERVYILIMNVRQLPPEWTSGQFWFLHGTLRLWQHCRQLVGCFLHYTLRPKGSCKNQLLSCSGQCNMKRFSFAFCDATTWTEMQTASVSETYFAEQLSQFYVRSPAPN